MSSWEYKVVPAPTKGVKARGVKGPEGRFANALETLMNEMSRDGWDYQRAETLPSIERAGLTGSSTEWRNVLVFRRAVTAPMDDFAPELLPPPAAVAAVPEKAAQAQTDTPADAVAQTEDKAPHSANNAPPAPKPKDAGEPKDILDVTASIKTLTGKEN